jgi:hypothetical protein
MSKKKYKNKEDEILRGYVKLVQAMLMNVYDKIRIKDSWHDKKLSQRMLTRKLEDLTELGAWLHTGDSIVWFNILSLCTGNGSRKMHETFIDTLVKSKEFIKRQTVDKKAVDRKKRLK